MSLFLLKSVLICDSMLQKDWSYAELNRELGTSTKLQSQVVIFLWTFNTKNYFCAPLVPNN